MESFEIIKKLDGKNYIIISDEDLKKLLSAAKIIEERETHISDVIRLLKLSDKLLIQEKSNKNELILRLMPNKKAAEEFIKNRLEIYDRMWDGCGCKVDYYV